MGSASLGAEIPIVAGLAAVGIAAFVSMAWVAPEGARYPVPEAPLRALPPADESDASVRAALERMGGSQLGALLVPRRLVERFVASVHAASVGKPLSMLPFVRPDARRAPRGPELTPQDFARYEPYVGAAESLDTRALAALYRRLYPLLEQTYRARVGTNAHFNDAVVAAIDDALAAPRPAAPVRLVRRGAVMAYEDPRLESLSALRKLMVRMGPGNAERLSVVLREVRARIALHAPPG